MNRRGFLQSLAAGAAVIMLPALAEEAVPEILSAAPEIPTTAAGLTTWMRGAFKVSDVAPMAYLEAKMADLPALYGFSVADVPKEKFAGSYDETKDIVRFSHKVVCFCVEGDDPVEAERRLVEYAYEELKAVAGQDVPLLLRVAPVFSHEKLAEYGDTYMTWEDIQDKGMPDALPEDVELDFNTDSLKYVKRRYTLNKLRLRLSLPTLPDDAEEALSIAEGTSPKRIT